MVRFIVITLLVAVLVTLADAARKIWILYQKAGEDVLMRVAPETLAIDVMNLHVTAAAGLVVGLIVATTVACWSTALRMLRMRPPPERAPEGPTPDEIIRAERARRADAYLAARRSGASPDAER